MLKQTPPYAAKTFFLQLSCPKSHPECASGYFVVPLWTELTGVLSPVDGEFPVVVGLVPRPPDDRERLTHVPVEVRGDDYLSERYYLGTFVDTVLPARHLIKHVFLGEPISL